MWNKLHHRGSDDERKGFTLLEVLLSVGIMALIAGIGAPIYARSQTKNDLDLAEQIWVESLRRATVLSGAVEGDSSWGVAFSSGAITVFQGTSHATRTTSYDEIFSIPTTISASGLTEVVMSKLTGYPTTAGTTTISSSAISDTGVVTINSKGMVSY